MNQLKKAYQYLFYKIYRFFESNEFSAWWSEWKSMLLVGILFFFLLLSLEIYYNIFIDRYIDLFPNEIIVIIICFIIGIYNYYLFLYKDKWKAIVNEFDKLPKKKNKIGSWLVFLFVCFVFANLIYSFYLMSQIDWTQYQ